MDKVPIGQVLKYKIQLTASGFDMASDPFDLIFSCGGISVKQTQDDVFADLEGNYYIAIDTTPFRSGALYMVTKAYVPDPDCPDGTRTEMDKQYIKELYKA